MNHQPIKPVCSGFFFFFFYKVGPYMILEYCEKGQLRDWLMQQKNSTSEDTIEQLYRIIYGISKGMCHLETKKVYTFYFRIPRITLV